MGEARVKKSRVARFLEEHPSCIYCGGKATTTDHCPPRCFFEGRQWPESYEFPACEGCNSEARLDEQALAVLVRIQLTDLQGRRRTEWERLLDGTANNWPDIVAEWKGIGGAQQKRLFRERFGVRGDDLRRAGNGLLKVGPITRAAINRFVIKLAKALYYRHTSEVFDGIVYAFHINAQDTGTNQPIIEAALKFAPALAISKRSGKDLRDQFIYRFNASSDFGVVHAVVRFSDQFIFQMIALRYDIADRLESDARDRGVEPPSAIRHECRLPARSEAT